jgi:hypothetical protein
MKLLFSFCQNNIIDSSFKAQLFGKQEEIEGYSLIFNYYLCKIGNSIFFFKSKFSNSCSSSDRGHWSRVQFDCNKHQAPGPIWFLKILQ